MSKAIAAEFNRIDSKKKIKKKSYIGTVQQYYICEIQIEKILKYAENVGHILIHTFCLFSFVLSNKT